MSKDASPLDPPLAPPEAATAAARSPRPWKPFLFVGLTLLGAPAAALAVLLGVLVNDAAQIVNAEPPRGARVEPPLSQLWTPAERDRLEAHRFFGAGVLAEDVRPWAVTPSRGMASVREPAARPYLAALERIRSAGRGEAPEALNEARALLSQADEALGGRTERVPILYHQALAAYLAGDHGEARRLLAGDEGRGRGALPLIEAARGPDLDRTSVDRLDGEEIAVRYLLGHALLKADEARPAVEQFEKALMLAQRTGYRGRYSGLGALDPQRHLTDLGTAALWSDLIAARARARVPMEGRGDNPDPATLFDRPTAVSSDPRLAASVAMLAALEGKAEVVGRITLAPGAPPEAAAAFAVARRAVGLAAPGAAAALEDLDVLRDWDRIGCLRRQRAPWLTHASQGAGCAGGDLGAFERRWQAQFSSRYAAALVGSPNGPAFVAADPRFGPLDRWAAAQRVSGRSPWISGALRILLLLAVAAVCIAAVVVNRMYDSVFAPMHFESRRRQGHLDPETRAP